MSTIEKVLKSEIQRLARKEVKAATADLRKANAAHRATLADLRRGIAQLEKEQKQLLKQVPHDQKEEPEAEAKTDEVAKARITAKMIKGIRMKLGLSQAQFAALIGVNGQSVYKWEKKEGRLSFRGDVKARIVAAKKMSKKEVAEKLELSQPK